MSEANDEITKVTWKKAFSLGWAIFWRSFAVGVIVLIPSEWFRTAVLRDTDPIYVFYAVGLFQILIGPFLCMLTVSYIILKFGFHRHKLFLVKNRKQSSSKQDEIDT